MSITSHYPWPVLGDKDAVSGIFTPIIEITFDKNTIKITGNFNLNNRTIQDLLSSGKANFVIQMTCVATHIRRCYFYSVNQFEIVIPAEDLRGYVKLDYLVVANTEILDYFNEASHPDYEGEKAKVSLMKGDVIAEAESGKFEAKKRYAGTRSISDIIEICRDSRISGPMIIIPEKEKIKINLPSIDFDKMSFFANSKTEKINSILQASVAFPALITALQYAFDEPEHYSQLVWFNVLKERSETAKIEWSKENIINITQNILKNPINRMLSGLKETIEGAD